MQFHLFAFAAIAVSCATAQSLAGGRGRDPMPTCFPGSVCAPTDRPPQTNICDREVRKCSTVLQETVHEYTSRRYTTEIIDIPVTTAITKTAQGLAVVVTTKYVKNTVGDCSTKTTTTHTEPELIVITQTRNVPTYVYNTTTIISTSTRTYFADKLENCFYTPPAKRLATSGQEASPREDSPNIAETEPAGEPLVDQTGDDDSNFGGFWPSWGSGGDEAQAE